MTTLLLLAVLGTAVQAPADSAALPTGARAVQAPVTDVLATLVAELERKNPELQADRREIDAAVARVTPAGALPDPVLTASSMTGFGRPPFFPSSSTPNAFRLVGVAQEIPYPGKRALRTSVAAAEAEAERWNYEDRRRALIADLKTTYLEYVLAVRSLEILADNRTLLDHLRQITEARFSVGKGLQQDVVKAQIEVSMLIGRRTVLEAQRDALVARMNALLVRPADAPAPPAGPYIADAVPRDVRALQVEATASYPALQRDATLIQKDRRSLELARKDLRPDFRIGLSAQRYTGDMPWMYGVDLMVTLPIYASRKQRPLVADAAATLDASERTRENTSNMAASEVAQAALAASSADQLVALYGDSVLPQARLALDSSLAAYEVGGVDFLSVLTNFQALLAAQLSQAEQQTRRDQALVRLEPFVGTEFVK